MPCTLAATSNETAEPLATAFVPCEGLESVTAGGRSGNTVMVSSAMGPSLPLASVAIALRIVLPWAGIRAWMINGAFVDTPIACRSCVKCTVTPGSLVVSTASIGMV